MSPRRESGKSVARVAWMASCLIAIGSVAGAVGASAQQYDDLLGELLEMLTELSAAELQFGGGEGADPYLRADIDRLLQAMQEGTLDDRAMAIATLGVYARESLRVLPALIDVLGGTQPSLRNAAALGLIEGLDLDDGELVPLMLAEMLSDPLAHHREQGARRLRRVSIEPTVAGAVQSALQHAASTDAEAAVRRIAQRTLDRLDLVVDVGDSGRRRDDGAGNRRDGIEPPPTRTDLRRTQFRHRASSEFLTISFVENRFDPANDRIVNQVRRVGGPNRGTSSAFPATSSWDLAAGESLYVDLPAGEYEIWVAYATPRPGRAHRLLMPVSRADTVNRLLELAGAPGAPRVTDSEGSARFLSVVDLAPTVTCSAVAPGDLLVGPQPSGALTVSTPAVPLILEVLQQTPLGMRNTPVDPEGGRVRTIWTTRDSARPVGSTRAGSEVASGGTLGNELLLPPLRPENYQLFLTVYDRVGLFDECRFDVAVVANTPPLIEVIAEQTRLDFGRPDEERVATGAIPLPLPVPANLCPFPDPPFVPFPGALASFEIPESTQLPVPSRTCVWAPYTDATVPPWGLQFAWQWPRTNFGAGNLYASVNVTAVPERDLPAVPIGTLLREGRQLEAYNFFWSSLAPPAVPSVVWEAPDDPCPPGSGPLVSPTGCGIGGEFAVTANVDDRIAALVRDSDFIRIDSPDNTDDASSDAGDFLLDEVRNSCGGRGEPRTHQETRTTSRGTFEVTAISPGGATSIAGRIEYEVPAVLPRAYFENCYGCMGDAETLSGTAAGDPDAWPDARKTAVPLMTLTVSMSAQRSGLTDRSPRTCRARVTGGGTSFTCHNGSSASAEPATRRWRHYTLRAVNGVPRDVQVRWGVSAPDADQSCVIDINYKPRGSED